MAADDRVEKLATSPVCNVPPYDVLPQAAMDAVPAVPTREDQ